MLSLPSQKISKSFFKVKSKSSLNEYIYIKSPLEVFYFNFTILMKTIIMRSEREKGRPNFRPHWGFVRDWVGISAKVKKKWNICQTNGYEMLSVGTEFILILASFI